jgi:SAM-dependent methyltransferase
MQHTPVLGGPTPPSAARTARKLSGFALRYVDARCGSGENWCLDVGCGNGNITRHLGQGFGKVVGIDIEPDRLDDFHAMVQGDPRYHILRMSSDALSFANNTFALVTSFEVLEHVPNLEKTIDEMVRVCRPDGVVALSVPQIWFPLENHGMVVNGRIIDHKIPLLPYLPALHRRFGAARVFSSHQLDQLFVGRGLEVLDTAYASPQFERAAANPRSWESHFTFLRKALDWSEKTPVVRQFTGVSILKAYRKPLSN